MTKSANHDTNNKTIDSGPMKDMTRAQAVAREPGHDAPGRHAEPAAEWSASPATTWPGHDQVGEHADRGAQNDDDAEHEGGDAKGELDRASSLPWRSSEPRFAPRGHPLVLFESTLGKGDLVAESPTQALPPPWTLRSSGDMAHDADGAARLGPAAQGLDEAAGHPTAPLVALDVDQVEPGQVALHVAMTHPDHASVDLGHKEGLVNVHPLPCGPNLREVVGHREDLVQIDVNDGRETEGQLDVQATDIAPVLGDASSDLHERWTDLGTQQLESLGVLAGGIAHDFNNLLCGIASCFALAKMNLDPHSEAGTILNEGERAALSASSLTRQLLTFAKGGAPVFTVIDAVEVVHDACTFSAHGSRIKLEFAVLDSRYAYGPTEASCGRYSRTSCSMPASRWSTAG